MKKITLILFVFSWFFICSHFAFTKWFACNNFKLWADDKLEEAGRPVEVVNEVNGAHSNITEREYQRILNQDDLDKLWQRHTDKIEDMPLVDFNADMVVAIFLGKGMNSAGIGGTRIRETDDALYFYFRSWAYQTAGPDGGGVEVEPFGFFVIPRSNKKLILEQDIRNRITGGPEKWKVVKEFEAIS